MNAYINVASYGSRNQLRSSEILLDPHFQLRKLEANIKSASFINFNPKMEIATNSGVSRNFVRGEGVQQIQLRTEDRENGDLVSVAP